MITKETFNLHGLVYALSSRRPTLTPLLLREPALELRKDCLCLCKVDSDGWLTKSKAARTRRRAPPPLHATMLSKLVTLAWSVLWVASGQPSASKEKKLLTESYWTIKLKLLKMELLGVLSLFTNMERLLIST